MKKIFLFDYLACILFRVLGALFRILPVEFSLFLGRILGDCFYYFDLRHKARSYSNIKIALGEQLSPKAIAKCTKEFYRSFGQSIIEIFLIPRVDKAYMDKYVTIRGLENIYAGLKRGKGVILITVHAGSWELSNIICANLGFPFVLFVRGQSLPRLNQLLNKYRREKGCKIITKEGGLKHLIDELKSNSAIGITLDQGGKSGMLVDFFGRSASMSTGGIKLALKYDASIIPVFFTRSNGPKIEVFVGEQLELSRSQDSEKDLNDNLIKITRVFEGFIRKYPKDYLWTYKIWKYSKERNILVLSDAKPGHLRQAEAVSAVVSRYLKNKGIHSKVDLIEVKFKSKLSKTALTLSSCFAGKYHCQGCLWCLRKFLKAGTYKLLTQAKPDIVISCGSSVAALNFIISREALSKSIVVMRPSFLSMKRFDLVVMPKHDHPPRNKFVVATRGALNLINQEYLKERSSELIRSQGINPQGPYIGLLIGGDSKKFHLNKDLMAKVINEVKIAAEEINAGILLTTSRRTSEEINDLIKQEFKDYPATKLMIIANEKNIPEAVGGILGLSSLVITSPESISMVSEAASSAKPVVVFKVDGLSRRHKEFLDNLAENNYIYLSDPDSLALVIADIWRRKPEVHILNDSDLVSNALGKII